MNDDLSSVIEQALHYASQLPVLNITATDTSGTTIQQSDHLFPTDTVLGDYTKSNYGAQSTDTCAKITISGKNLPLEQHADVNAPAKTVADDRSSDLLDLVPVSLDLRTHREVNSQLVYLDNTNLLSPQYEPVQHSSVSTTNSRPVTDCTDPRSVSSSNGTPSKVQSPDKPETPKVKKTRRREKNPDPPPEPILPACSVCDEKSSGFHYGANTCEACKGFFRRTLKKKEVKYKCKCKPDVKEEWKRGPVKNGCASCRYERCLTVGMSKNAIKIGRYTLKHKTSNINQVKSVESIDSLIDAAMLSVSESSPSSASGADFCISSPEDVRSPMMSEEYVVSTTHHSNADEYVSQSKISKIDQMSGLTKNNSVVSLKEMDSIVKILTESQTAMDFDDNFRIPIEIIKQKQTEYLEKYKMKKELFGDMGLSKEEFDEFYNITGIDLDGRIQHIDGAFNFFEQKISFIVAFAKSIPGFKTLTVNDQANLIKASRTENTLFGGYRGIIRNFDMERRILTTPWGKEIHMDELARIVPIDFILKKYEYGRMVMDLDLTTQEDSVIRAIVTMFSDRCTLEEPEKVDQIQEKLVACLQHLLNIRSGGAGTQLYKIFNLITNLRNFSENENEFTKKLLQDWPMVSTNKYQLLKEFLA